jgi:hypothetical protein
MKRKSEPRIVPRLGTLPAPKVISRYRHVQALGECGGQMSLSGGVQGDAFAFGSKGFWAGVRAGGGGLVDTSLRRLDWAIAIGNQTGVRVDEISGVSGGVIAGGPPVQNRPMLRFPRIQSLIDGGGTISFGDCKPGAAVASKSTGIVATLAFRNEEVLALLRRLDWSIGLAESRGKCLDEVFHGIAPLPKRKAAAKKPISKTPTLDHPVCEYNGMNYKGVVERMFSIINAKNCHNVLELDFTTPNIYLVKTIGQQSTKLPIRHVRHTPSSTRTNELAAPKRYEWGMIDGKRQRREKKPKIS